MSESIHVSAQQRARVAAIIEKKIVVLQSWAQEGVPWSLTQNAKLARDADGCPTLIYFPIDIRSFAEWHCTLYATSDLERDPRLSELESFARSTLVQPHNLDNHTRVKHLLLEVSQKASRQLEELDSGGKIRRLEAHIERLNATILRQESEIDIFRSEADAERQRRVKSEKLLDRVRRSARAKIAQLESLNPAPAEIRPAANVVSLGKPRHTGRRSQ